MRKSDLLSDLKDQGLAHFPSGTVHANAAWTVLAVLAHNLLRWTQVIGLPGTTIRTARTLRDQSPRGARQAYASRPPVAASAAGAVAVGDAVRDCASPPPRTPATRLTRRGTLNS